MKKSHLHFILVDRLSGFVCNEFFNLGFATNAFLNVNKKKLSLADEKIRINISITPYRKRAYDCGGPRGELGRENSR